jgi:hypothetical protein
MSFEARVLNIMIASPGDVDQERSIVTEELYSWNDVNASSRRMILLPLKWETRSTPEYGAHPQTILNRQLLAESDILVAIFGTRIGTPTAEHVSGTVEEVKRHVTAKKPAKIYFSDVPVSPSSINREQYDLVQAFKLWCQDKALYAGYKTVKRFRTDFRRHLYLELNDAKYSNPQTSKPVMRESRASHSGVLQMDGSKKDGAVGDDALRLLVAASNDDGTVMYSETLSGTSLRAGKEQLMDGTPRSTAKWKAILKGLVDREAVEGLSDSLYQLTDYGYELVDKATEAPQKSAFDEAQLESVRSRTAALQYFERDFLRFLVINGDSRADALYKSATNVVGFDVNTFSMSLIQAGLVRRTDDYIEGYPTFHLNQELREALKKVLFPRDEQKPPCFSGLP